MAYIVLNVRGTIDASEQVRRTLRMLRIPLRYRATILPESDSVRGMLQKARHRIAWCKADKELVKELIEKRGMKEGWKKLEKSDLKRLGYSGFDELAEAIAEDRVDFGKLDGIKPFFALSPPRGGFKRTVKRFYEQGGVLGENPELPELIRRML
ncbi:MAG: 50S ribosomal protein L30 [Thaumarchaeota archaeon]|nr:50S ribosomal protein L30 [Nitrososphaerota archaeon]